MNVNPSEFEELKRVVTELSGRLEQLERRLNTPATQARPAPNVFPPPPAGAPRSSSLESRVGAQYLNRAGVLALLAAASFFLHWAFTNHWITPTTQILIGIAAGLAVFVWGEWFVRRSYSNFGFSLKALGVGTLYLSVWAALQFYHLVPFWVGFAGMVVITAGATVVALLQSSENLAAFACVGGFATPLLITNGPLIRTELLSYLVVLTLGMLVAVVFRAWKSLLLVTVCGYAIVDFSTLLGVPKSQSTYLTLALSTVFMLSFAAAPILVTRRDDRQNSSVRVLLVPIIAGLIFLSEAEASLGWSDTAIVVAIMAALLIGASQNLNQRLQVVYFSLGITGLAIAVPMRFDHHWTTSITWLALGVVLVAIGFLKQYPIARWNGLVLVIVTLGKVFLSDLASLSQGSRVLITTILGVMLLAVSFAYQKLWAKK